MTSSRFAESTSWRGIRPTICHAPSPQRYEFSGGFHVPILATSSGHVVDGHLRLKAAQRLRLESVPVVLCDDWTEDQIRAFRILVNSSAQWADWDMDRLSAELAALQAVE